MRNYILFYINGQRHTVEGEAVFAPLSDYLRYQACQTGTKVVCAEGDCGACTVLIGKPNGQADLSYKTLNSCIQYLYQVDGCHIITVEGLQSDQSLHPVQNAMIQCHGAQCGYCTPGMVMALCGLFERKNPPAPSREVIQDALIGNLCRCTGYDAIIEAGLQVSLQDSLFERYASEKMYKELTACQTTPVNIETHERQFFKPLSLADAVQFKTQYPHASIINGGTDMHVVCNKRFFEPANIMSLANIETLRNTKIHANTLIIGASVTLAELETEVQTLYPEFAKMLHIFGSPQIKQAGTLAGNIATGSPIGDSLPFLMVLDASVEVTGPQGDRLINMNQLYRGYRSLDMEPSEWISHIHIPLPQASDILKLYKVSRREHLDISTFGAAVRLQYADHRIEGAQIAYGGVGPTVLRLPKTEAFLTGETPSLTLFKEAGQLAKTEITPISDVRGSQDFRLQLGQSILEKFYYETLGQEEALATV